MAAVRFTTRWIEKLKPTGDRVEYLDADETGLTLRVTKHGAKTFYLLLRRPDEKLKIRVRLGPYDADGLDAKDALEIPAGSTPPLSLSGARALAAQKKIMVATGTDPREARQVHKATPTLKGLLDEYMERHGVNCRRPEEIKRLIEFDCKDLLDRKASKITRRELRAVLEVVAIRAPIVANRLLGALRAVLNWGVAQDILPASPAVEIPRPAPETMGERVLSTDEIKALWTRLDAEPWKVARACQLVLATGQRPGEVAAMRWDEIDETAKAWTIPSGKVKTGKATLVPLTDLALGLINRTLNSRNPDKVGPVFRRRNDHIQDMGAKAPGAYLFRWMKEWEFTPCTAHDLRRTANTHWARLGIPKEIRDKLLNHGPKKSLEATYNLFDYFPQKRDALDRWSLEIMRIVHEDETKVVQLPKRKRRA